MRCELRSCCMWLALALLLLLSRAQLQAAELVEPTKLEALVKPLIDDGWLNAAAIGLISEKGTQTFNFGHVADAASPAPSADTEFEIGSISKVFTGLLLAQMVDEKLVRLDEPVQELLGDSVKMPVKDDRQITLVDLATHSSGLPRMPNNFKPKDATNPYADYTVEQMNEFVSGFKLKRLPGARSDYSNLGMGLLGHALALKSGMSYEELLRKRICEPLAMSDTVIALDESQKSRLAVGHDGDGTAVANWDIPTLAGAGAIRSTVADMLKFLAANIGLKKAPFDAAIQLAQHVHYTNPPGTIGDVGLAWQIMSKRKTIWHNGQTGGYHSFAAFMPEKQLGVVVLTNTGSSKVDLLGFAVLKLLDTGSAEPLKLPPTMEISADDLQPLVGEYTMAPLGKVTITREGNQLWLQITGQPKARFYPESKTRFNCRMVDAAITFEREDDGKIKQLVIHQNGADISAPRAK